MSILKPGPCITQPILLASYTNTGDLLVCCQNTMKQMMRKVYLRVIQRQLLPVSIDFALKFSQKTNALTVRCHPWSLVAKITKKAVEPMCEHLTKHYTTVALLGTNSSCTQTTDHCLNTSSYYSANSAANN